MYMNSMDNNTFYSFSLEKPLSYVATGKFEAPSQEWMHLDRWLGEDFELMVVTNGTLYMGDDSGKFEVSTGVWVETFCLLFLLAPFCGGSSRHAAKKQTL